MPLYEYRCDDCGHRFEILQRIGESADGLGCPECGAEGLAKQHSTFASASAGKMEARPAPAGGCCQGTLT